VAGLFAILCTMKLFHSLLAVCALLLLFGCAEPPYLIHQKLDATLHDDLKYMVGEVVKGSGKQNLLDKPYYIVKDLRFFQGDTANMYSGYAEVDFYYFRGIPMFQKRKYRYDVKYRNWDRYYKKLIFMDSTSEKPSNSLNFPKKESQ